MSGLGGLNKSPDGVVIGLVQIANPRGRDARATWRGKTERICALVSQGAAQTWRPWTWSCSRNIRCTACRWTPIPEIMCRLDGPEVAGVPGGLHRQPASGAASRSWSSTRDGNPYNSGLIIDDEGEIKLYYRKMHPWVPVEPWEPGDLGIPVCDGPNGSQDRADHLPRRHVPRDGARVRLQGRQHHDPHGRLHGADPRTPGASPTRPTRSAT